MHCCGAAVLAGLHCCGAAVPVGCTDAVLHRRGAGGAALMRRCDAAAPRAALRVGRRCAHGRRWCEAAAAAERSGGPVGLKCCI